MIESEAAPIEPRGSFLASVNVVAMTYAVDGLLAFASGVIVARALGPDGRGAVGLFTVSTAIAQMVLGLGFANAAIYYVNKREMAVPEVVAAAHVITLASLVATTLAVLMTVLIAGSDALGDGVTAWLLIAAVPALMYAATLRAVLQSTSRFMEMGIATLAQPFVMLSLVSVVYAVGNPSPSLFVIFWILSNMATALFAVTRIGAKNLDLALIVRPRWATLRRLARFGVQGETGNVLQLLNYRLDQYLVRAFVGLAGVGIYAVGVSLTEGVWLLANAVAIVLLPRLTAAEPDEVRWMAPLATRNTLLVASVGAIALGVVAKWLVPAFFTHRFDASVGALWWLLPGTVALTGSKVITSYIFSQGRPFVNTLITLASLAVTLVALLLLVPPFGINGAAAASSVAYITHFIVALYAYRRISGQPVLDAVVPRLSDARLYSDAAASIISRLRRRPAPLGDGADAQRAGG